ncbi:hypothetical protein O6H91_Y042500 [Diphasiastrum complanatum]|nr:hypothetical protein O6H91_Y042500 [Diphasiastrum complanatum]
MRMYSLSAAAGLHLRHCNPVYPLPKSPKHLQIDVEPIPTYQVSGGCNSRCLKVPESEHALDFYGVYDGHGGSQASLFCKHHLHIALAEEVKALNVAGTGTVLSNWKLQWENVRTTCFLKVDAGVGGECSNGSKCTNCQENGACSGMVAPVTAGSTAVVAIIGLCQIIVGNSGDSRAVISRGGKAIALSDDHKPEREDEKARIEAAGGSVIFWNGYRVFGVLANVEGHW